MDVLVVEADEQRRQDLIGGLEARGYVTLAAADVDHAEALARERRIGLALCDSDLVIGPGSFLAEALRRSSATVLYTCPERLAPERLRTFWLNRGADVPSVVRLVEWLQPPRPKIDDSKT